MKTLALAICLSSGTLPAADAVRAPWSALVPRAPTSAERFVGPDGKPGNAGTRESPWDLASALAGRPEIGPGDVVWVAGGTYRGRFDVKLRGAEGAPVIVRAMPDARATVLDSPMAVVEPADHVWLWGLEIAGSTPLAKRVTAQSGSSPGDLPGGGAAGLEIRAGRGCKFVDLVIHDAPGGGLSWWVGSTDGEVSGCIISGNGWKGPDRGHGHCIYTQNKDGTKTISNCILSVPLDGSFTVHAYGSARAYVDNYLLTGNVCFARGPFLVGGGRPSRGIRVVGNYLHGVDMRIGYGADNEDCEVADNVVVGGKITIEKYRRAVDRGNVRDLKEDLAALIPGKYDPTRAHAVLYSPGRAAAAKVPVRGFLAPGERFRALDPRDAFGPPIAEMTCAGDAIELPLGAEFRVLVIVKM